MDAKANLNAKREVIGVTVDRRRSTSTNSSSSSLAVPGRDGIGRKVSIFKQGRESESSDSDDVLHVHQPGARPADGKDLKHRMVESRPARATPAEARHKRVHETVEKLLLELQDPRRTTTAIKRAFVSMMNATPPLRGKGVALLFDRLLASFDVIRKLRPKEDSLFDDLLDLLNAHAGGAEMAERTRGALVDTVRKHETAGAPLRMLALRQPAVQRLMANLGQPVVPVPAAAVQRKIHADIDHIQRLVESGKPKADVLKAFGTVLNKHLKLGPEDDDQGVEHPANLVCLLDGLAKAYPVLERGRAGERLFDDLLDILFAKLRGPQMADGDRKTVLTHLPRLWPVSSDPDRQDAVRWHVLAKLRTALSGGKVLDSSHVAPCAAGLFATAPSRLTRSACFFADEVRSAVLEIAGQGARGRRFTDVSAQLGVALGHMEAPAAALSTIGLMSAQMEMTDQPEAFMKTLVDLLEHVRQGDPSGERMAYICLGATLQSRRMDTSLLAFAVMDAMAQLADRCSPTQNTAMALAVAAVGPSETSLDGWRADADAGSRAARVRQAVKDMRALIPPMGEGLLNFRSTWEDAIHGPRRGSGRAGADDKALASTQEAGPEPQGREAALDRKAQAAPAQALPAGERGDIGRHIDLLVRMEAEGAGAQEIVEAFELGVNTWSSEPGTGLSAERFGQYLEGLVAVHGVLAGGDPTSVLFDRLLDALLQASGGIKMPQASRVRLQQVASGLADASLQTREQVSLSIIRGLATLNAAPGTKDGSRWMQEAMRSFIGGLLPRASANADLSSLSADIVRVSTEVPSAVTAPIYVAFAREAAAFAAALDPGDPVAARTLIGHMLRDLLAQVKPLGPQRLAHAVAGLALAFQSPTLYSLRPALFDAIAAQAPAWSEDDLAPVASALVGRVPKLVFTQWVAGRSADQGDRKYGPGAAGVENRVHAALAKANQLRLALINKQLPLGEGGLAAEMLSVAAY